MPDKYDYRFRVGVSGSLPEAKTLKYIKNLDQEAYHVLCALQAFYGFESVLAEQKGDQHEVALESIGILLDQVVLIAEKAGIELEQLSTEPEILSRLIQDGKQRRSPYGSRARRVKLKINGTEAQNQTTPEQTNGSSGKTPVSIEITKRLPEVPTVEVEPPMPTTALAEEKVAKPRKSRMF